MRLRYTGKCPKIVELPVPFIQKCEKEGEVIFNPEAEVPDHYAEKLLELSGPDGPFQLAEAVSEDEPPAVTEKSEGAERIQLSAKYKKHRGRKRWQRKAVPVTQEARENEPSPAMEG